MDSIRRNASCLKLVMSLALSVGVTVDAVEGPDPLLPPPTPADEKPKPANDPLAKPATPPSTPPNIAVAKRVLLPVPDEAAQSAALEALRDTYKDEYAKRKPAERLELGQILLQEGKQRRKSAAHRWVCLHEAIDLASRQGDVDTVLAAVEVIEKWFAVPPREQTAQALSALTPNLSDPSNAQTAVFALLSLIDNCIAADDYVLAVRLCKDCDTIARKLRDQAITARAKALSERTKELSEEFEKLGELRDLLGEMTSDGHHRLGLFLCLFKNEWLTGVLHLVAGGEKTWGDLGRLDLAAHAATDKPGGDGSQALAAGEGWRGVASDLPRGTQRESAQTRALTWYRRALPALTGLNKAKAEKRIAELERALGPGAQGNLPLYPPGPALLLTFEADTLALAGTRLTGVVDASGSGLRFPASGVKPVRGPFGIALEFDGTGQIDVGNPKQLQIAGNQTIAFWMWTAALDLRRNPYNKSYGAEGTITLEPNGTLNFFYGPTGKNADPYTSAAMNIAVTAKAWVHLAVVRDFTSKTVTWYRNGKATTPVPLPYPMGSVSSLPLIIGNGYTNPFIGQLDDIGVWPRALSAQEITSLHGATSTGR